MKLFPDISVFVFLFSFVINIESPVGNYLTILLFEISYIISVIL